MSEDVMTELVQYVPSIPVEGQRAVAELCQKLCLPYGADWLEKLKKFLRQEPTWHDEQVVMENPFSDNEKLPEGAIIRRVRVKRDRTLQEALDATGGRQHINPNVLVTAPTGVSEDVEVIFIPLGHFMSDKGVDKFIPAGYRLADPWELAAVNEEDPAFADKYPNFTHWQIAGDKAWHWATFRNWDSERSVRVGRGGYEWYGSWWVAVVRKDLKSKAK